MHDEITKYPEVQALIGCERCMWAKVPSAV